MESTNQLSDATPQEEIEQLRTVILGDKYNLITETIDAQARNIVGKVVAEALHDRQKADNSINTVLLPIVESAVDHSVTHHSDRLVNSLYPLMGSLIRKSVGAFLSDFIEKTNQLIEHNFTIKGMKWRFQAWKAGISFTEYIVSQTYNYRVEHVLLIHQETGLLLNSVNLDQHNQNDADLISSMLTAINDFVGDSFQISKDGLKEQLQTVSTDNFNLLIKPGPNAIIVAAITGTPPQQVSDQLQITLEDIHRLYTEELKQFKGDNAPFKNTENQLRECLLTEEKNTELTETKKSRLIWIMLLLISVFIGFRLQNWYQLNQLNKLIMQIDQQSGIVVQKLDIKSLNDITLDIMRDPDAITIEKWLSSHQLSIEHFNVKERRYRSLSPEIFSTRITKIASHYPTLLFKWENPTLSLTGQINAKRYHDLTLELLTIGILEKQIDRQKLVLNSANDFSENISVNQQIFKALVGKVSGFSLHFTIGNSQITQSMKAELRLLTEDFLHLSVLARKLNINVELLLIGSSDNLGNKNINIALSAIRAENTAAALTQLGLMRENIFITSITQVETTKMNENLRSVMFNVIYNESVFKNIMDEK